jgi:hypothetical protein
MKQKRSALLKSPELKESGGRHENTPEVTVIWISLLAMGTPSTVDRVAVMRALPKDSPKSGASTFARTDSEQVENSGESILSIWAQETPAADSIKAAILVSIVRPSSM